MPSKLVSALKRQQPKPKKREPLWTGPSGDGPNGGVTQGLIGRFLVCRERFRLHAVEGLRPADQFSHRLEFGSMWHVCEESHASPAVNWGVPLQNYCQQLCRRYPLQQEAIEHWYQMTKALFPRYVEHWSKHPDVKDRTPLLQEQAFDVPYKLPSGREVRLRGKWDSVDLLPAHVEDGRKYPTGIWLQENKTKSSIDAVKIARQVKFDLQTMLYLVALTEEKNRVGMNGQKSRTLDYPILGTRYNVIRRSAHKSVESMLKKVDDDAAAGRIGEWFARWKVEVTPTDLARFRRECLDPVLEQMYDWWEHVSGTAPPFDCRPGNRDYMIHWRHPFGIYNVLDEGGSSDVDGFLDTGSTVGLTRAEKLYPELQ